MFLLYSIKWDFYLMLNQDYQPYQGLNPKGNNVPEPIVKPSQWGMSGLHFEGEVFEKEGMYLPTKRSSSACDLQNHVTNFVKLIYNDHMLFIHFNYLFKSMFYVHFECGSKKILSFCKFFHCSFGLTCTIIMIRQWCVRIQRN